VRLMEVTVFLLPRPWRGRVTMINFPRRLNKGSESSSSLTFRFVIPMFEIFFGDFEFARYRLNRKKRLLHEG